MENLNKLRTNLLSSAALSFSSISSTVVGVLGGDEFFLTGGVPAGSAMMTSYLSPPCLSSLHLISVAGK